MGRVLLFLINSYPIALLCISSNKIQLEKINYLLSDYVDMTLVLLIFLLQDSVKQTGKS